MTETTNEPPATPEPAPPLPGTEARFHRFRVGNLECVSLSDGAIRVPLGPPEPGKPMQFRLVPLACLLVTLPKTGKVVLIDSGCGDNPEILGKPLFTDGRLAESLAMADIAPESIDAVLVSHFDPDHVNGLFHHHDGSKMFPCATYYAAAEEIAFWSREPIDLSGSPTPEPVKNDRLKTSSRFLSLAGDTIQTFHAGEQLMPGVTSIAAPGHTPGQVGFIFDGDSASLLYTGDSMTHAVVSVETPDVYHPLDFYPDQGVATRHQMIQLLLEKGWQSFSPHFPFPAFGRIDRAGEGAVWKALG